MWHLRAVQASHEPCLDGQAAEGPRRARWRRGFIPLPRRQAQRQSARSRGVSSDERGDPVGCKAG
eukprot:scaffold47008_cov34-Phaeocystis_antarctica.AAC.1